MKPINSAKKIKKGKTHEPTYSNIIEWKNIKASVAMEDKKIE